MSTITLLRERSHGLEMILVVVVPVIFGAITGIMLGISEPVYVVLSLLGIAGGLLAGMEHEGAIEGFYRGLLGGLLFGLSILTAHGLADDEPEAHLPDPEVLLIVITAVAGAILGALGGRLRERGERKARRG